MSRKKCEKGCNEKMNQEYIEVLENILSVYSCIPQHTLKTLTTFNFNKYEKLKTERMVLMNKMKSGCECVDLDDDFQLSPKVTPVHVKPTYTPLKTKTVNKNSKTNIVKTNNDSTSPQFSNNKSEKSTNANQSNTIAREIDQNNTLLETSISSNINETLNSSDTTTKVHKVVKKFTFKKLSTSTSSKEKSNITSVFEKSNKEENTTTSKPTTNTYPSNESKSSNIGLLSLKPKNKTSENISENKVTNTSKNLKENNDTDEENIFESTLRLSDLNSIPSTSKQDTLNTTKTSETGPSKKKFVFKKKTDSLNETITSVSQNTSSSSIAPSVSLLNKFNEKSANSSPEIQMNLSQNSTQSNKNSDVSNANNSSSKSEESTTLITNSQNSDVLLDDDGWQIYNPEAFDAIDTSVAEALKDVEIIDNNDDDVQFLNATIADVWEQESRNTGDRNIHCINDDIESLFETSTIEIKNTRPKNNVSSMFVRVFEMLFF